MAAPLERIRALWGRAWPLPLLPAVYSAVIAAVGDLRVEHVVFALACPLLAFAGPRSKQFFVDFSPFILVAMGYDAVRYVLHATLTPGRIITCGMRDLELTLFSAGGGRTLQDFSQTHAVVALDLLFAIPYGIFAYVAALYSAYLFFVDRPRMRHYLWAFAIANYLSFLLWVLVPAAPPWYIRAHGCAVDLGVSGNPAGLARVDALLGIDYFHAFYSRASQIFGAIPSMHCAYPVIGLVTAWRAATMRTRPLHIVYAATMFSASVYLDHHWVVDGVLGWVIAALSCWAAGRLLGRPTAGFAPVIDAVSGESQPPLAGSERIH